MSKQKGESQTKRQKRKGKKKVSPSDVLQRIRECGTWGWNLALRFSPSPSLGALWAESGNQENRNSLVDLGTLFFAPRLRVLHTGDFHFSS